MNFLAWLVIILILVGIALRFAPIEERMKRIIYAVIIVALIVIGLGWIGVLPKRLWPSSLP